MTTKHSSDSPRLGDVAEPIELEPSIEDLTEAYIDANTLALMDDCTTAINVVLHTLPPVLALIVLRERVRVLSQALAISPERLAEFIAEVGELTNGPTGYDDDGQRHCSRCKAVMNEAEWLDSFGRCKRCFCTRCGFKLRGDTEGTVCVSCRPP